MLCGGKRSLSVYDLLLPPGMKGLNQVNLKEDFSICHKKPKPDIMLVFNLQNNFIVIRLVTFQWSQQIQYF